MGTTGNTNSCNIFTVFPMGIVCDSRDVTTYGGDEGQVTIYITGGTSPYTIQWSNGSSNVTTITGLTAGSYTAEVVDFYGDYTASTTCVVGSVSPSPSPTPTPTPTPSVIPTYPSNMCLTQSAVPYTQLEFDYQGLVNGYPSWSGTTGDVIYDSTNSRWVISGYSSNNLRKVSNATIPTGTWTEFGTRNTWNMITGTCVTQSLTLNVVTTDETCVNESNGTVTLSAYGGDSPYTYSLDGLTYSATTTFFGLPDGNGTAYVKDSNGTVVSQNYNIGTGTNPTTYTLNISTTTTTNSNLTYDKSKTVSWSATVTPALPSGVNLNANIQIQNFLTDYYYGNDHIEFISASTITATGNASIITTTNSTTSSSGDRNCGGSFVNAGGWENTGFTRTHSVTFSGGGSGTISGTETFKIQQDPPLTATCPVYGYNYFSIGTNSPSLSGTNCGTAQANGGTNESISTSPYPSGT